MTQHLKLYPGATANDSSRNRRWISQENVVRQPGHGRAAAEPAGPVAVNPVAVWEDDGGNASFPTGSDRTARRPR
ncbi:hypothetical protein [Phenylobacterium sp.]|uniref:hypothetical protein n=1 Tax=Phenylobacterium sp. TaxID=1871053 RepID=UPI00289E633C|nr:hypothetical protein [Phenylobacterium sp.]